MESSPARCWLKDTMTSPDEKLLKDVKGFLDTREGSSLYKFALKASRRGPCLEIGSYCGKSTIYLGIRIVGLQEVGPDPKKSSEMIYAI